MLFFWWKYGALNAGILDFKIRRAVNLYTMIEISVSVNATILLCSCAVQFRDIVHPSVEGTTVAFKCFPRKLVRKNKESCTVSITCIHFIDNISVLRPSSGKRWSKWGKYILFNEGLRTKMVDSVCVIFCFCFSQSWILSPHTCQ